MNLRDTYQTRYGMDWPPEYSEHSIHLELWQRWREEPYTSASFLNPISEHFLQACSMLFTEKQLVRAPWFEKMAFAHTYNRVCLFLGAAATGKSHFAGIACLMRLLASPTEAYACLVSTSKEALLQRSMASAIEYFGYLKSNGNFEVPFRYIGQLTSIVPEDAGGKRIDQVRAMVRGVAISEGSDQDAKSSLIGSHLPRVMVVADEFENMGSRAKAFRDAQSNLAVCMDYNALYLFNPQSQFLPGCQLATPKDGWNSVNLDSEEWDTVDGYKVLRFDAYKSPGRKDPKKYPFLPTEETIAAVIKDNHGNEDAPGVWTFLRAFPPPNAEAQTVLTEAMVRTYGLLEPTAFATFPTRIAALDPAFTTGGDNVPFVVAKCGTFVDGTLGVAFESIHYLRIEASNPKPVTEQLVDQIVELLESEDVTPEHLGVDDSGTQSVADAIVTRLGRQVVRFNYSEKPPDIAVSANNPESCQKKYKNVITWLYYSVKELAERRQVRNLPSEAASQFCKRRVSSKKPPHMLESKADMKKRINGRSPDEADACSMVVGVARRVLGLMPGATEWRRGGAVQTGYSGMSEDVVKQYNNLLTSYNSP